MNNFNLKVFKFVQIYVDYFSRALSHEVRNSGVTVQTLIPFYIATNLTKFSDFIGRQSVLVPNAQTFVRSALSTLGICDRTTGYWSHELQVCLLLIPAELF
jgi:17beta-estradiol 17-dehydrogenase / very-long-chain 3-oxoacyl-CoA reductase